jgi:hypothetical protein
VGRKVYLMKRYVSVVSAAFSTLALLKYMELIPFGTPVGFLIISGLHLTYYWAITTMSSDSESTPNVIGQNRRKRLPNKIKVPPSGETELPNQVMSDVLKALSQLGYARRTSHELIKVVQKNYPQLKKSEEIIKECIKKSVAQ